jgi:hypothetical protein
VADRPRIDKAWLDTKLDELGLRSGANPEASNEALAAWGVDGVDLRAVGLELSTEMAEQLKAMLMPDGVELLRRTLGQDWLAITLAASQFAGGFEVGYIAALEREP